MPCPLSSITKLLTESVAKNFQLLFDYVYDDASAHFSDTITNMLRKFSTDVYAVSNALYYSANHSVAARSLYGYMGHTGSGSCGYMGQRSLCFQPLLQTWNLWLGGHAFKFRGSLLGTSGMLAVSMVGSGCEVFFTCVILQTGLGVHPDDENIRVPVMAWSTCAFTIMTTGSVQPLDVPHAAWCHLVGDLSWQSLFCVHRAVLAWWGQATVWRPASQAGRLPQCCGEVCRSLQPDLSVWRHQETLCYTALWWVAWTCYAWHWMEEGGDRMGFFVVLLLLSVLPVV